MTQRDSFGADALERYRGYLMVLAYSLVDRRLHAKIDPSGIVQDTLLEAHQAWPQLRGKTSGEQLAWLRVIHAHNLADALRAAHCAKRNVKREQSLEEAMNASSMRLADCLAADQPSPSQHLQRQEQAVRVAETLMELPEDQREALSLHFCCAMPVSQLAARMACTEDAVAGLIKRGLRRMRQRLQEGSAP